ncbi:MAG: beta-eliminating lyase-related protein [Flavobacteriales bacterium]|nr:beta-eliminating lyase-related protein [Flavobacteriales bacterium]
MIDLRSDTVTKPSKKMLDFMSSCEVGDDVFQEDPTVLNLENRLSNMFGMEAGIFCPSGTMANQIAIKCQGQPGEQVICDELSHIYNYEGGGIAFNSGASVKLLNGKRGIFTSEDIEMNISPDDPHFPVSRLVSIENTCNKGGGAIWSLDEMKAISNCCQDNNLKLHLDGARLFNAIVASSYNADHLSGLFDSISICLSKGLGAPIGSVLVGSNAFIKKARRIRKVFGGGMRQAGYLAAAGLFALEHNIERLEQDHKRAQILGDHLNNLNFVSLVFPVETNIVLVKTSENFQAQDIVSRLERSKIKIVSMGKHLIRFVTHLDFDDMQLEEVLKKLRQLDD